MHAEKLKDVFVTDHTPKVKQFLTTSEEEDQQYYNYMKSLSDYNKKLGHEGKPLNQMESGKYERGSMMQRVFEPLAGAVNISNGGLFMEIIDKDVALDCDEDKARKLYDLLKEDQLMEGDDGSDELRIANTKSQDLETYINTDSLRERMEKEFGLFLKGEKYSYVDDIRNAYQEDLATPMELKIIRTMPDHVFHDIKTPDKRLIETTEDNPWNPSRRNPNINFFEMRKEERWLTDKKELRKLDASLSRHRNY